MSLTRLTENQNKAFKKFKKLKVGALFMEQGTGKTLTALQLINYNINSINLVLWFTPHSTKNNLKKEIEKWGGLSKELVIFGWETLSQSDRQYLDLLEKIKDKNIFIVADESIFVKNSQTKRYSRLQNISKFSEYRLILNGTPLTKNEWDVYHQMNFLSPKIINMDEHEFLQTFYKHVRFKKRGQKAQDFYQLSDINIDYLHDLIDPYIFKVDLVFDKEEEEIVKFITPRETTLANYSEIKNNALKDLHKYDSSIIINLLNKLNHISSLDTQKAKEIAKYSTNRQVIIFCGYIKEAELIGKYLKKCYTITGSTENREEIFNDFKNNNHPLIMTFGVGAFGLNLQYCNEIIFSSLTFDYSKVLQAKARIKRIGQEHNIKYVFFDADLPINRFIGKNIDKKANLCDLIIKKLTENQKGNSLIL